MVAAAAKVNCNLLLKQTDEIDTEGSLIKEVWDERIGGEVAA